MKVKIIEIIKGRRSYTNAITSAEIRNILGYSLSDEEMRSLVAEAIESPERALIGSCSRGFYWIVTHKDLEIAKAYIASRIEPLRKRVAALDFNFAIASKIQTEMELKV